MSALERLDQIEQRAREYSGLGFEHEGDCAGSLCSSCGHCLHTVDADGCKCADCGCIDAVDDDEVLMKRDALRMAAAIRSALAEHWPSTDHGADMDPYCVPCWEASGMDGGPTYPCATVRAIEAALAP